MQKESSLKLNCSHSIEALRSGLKVLAIGLVVSGATLSMSAVRAKHGHERPHKVTKSVTIPIQPRIVYQLTRELVAGRLKKVQQGEPGSVVETVEYTKVLNHVISKKIIHEDRHPAKDTIILMGKGGFQPSRGAFYRRAVRTMIATAYDPSPGTNGSSRPGVTCTGRTAKYGIIAVDPRVIPFGTLMYIEGYGFGIAADRGSAIKGNRIDLCVPTKRMANRFGRQPVRVHILASR